MPRYEVEVSVFVDAPDDDAAAHMVDAILATATDEGRPGGEVAWMRYDNCVTLADEQGGPEDESGRVRRMAKVRPRGAAVD